MTSILSRTMLVVVGLLSVTSVTSYAARDMQYGGWGLLFFFLMTLGAMVGALVCAKREEYAFAITLGVLFAALEGCILGPVLRLYVEELGPSTVSWVFVLTAMIMAGCGFIASVVSIPYRKAESILLMVLFGFVLFGLVLAFGAIESPTVHYGWSVIGAVLFVAYFLVDFARIHDTKNGTWGDAIEFGIHLYLDFINLFLHLLRLSRD